MPIKSKHTLKSLKAIEKITGGKLTLGKLIWAIRKSTDKTLEEFSDILNISKQHLCDIEHNRKSISPRLAAKYASRLKLPEDQFVRLCLQDMVDKAELHLVVDIKYRSSKKISLNWSAIAA